MEVNCFIKCESYKYGGATEFYVDSSLRSCMFDRCNTHNSSGFEGGGIYIKDANLNLTFCKFIRCISKVGGGGIYFEGTTTLRLESTIFYFCVQVTGGADTNGGGGLKLSGGRCFCQNCSFLNCETNRYGGGIYQTKGIGDSLMHLENCVFASCVGSAKSGGGINVINTTLECEGCVFIHNRARQQGAAILIESSNDITIIDTSFVRNYLVTCYDYSGAAICLIVSSDVLSPKFQLLSCTFLNNVINASKSCGMFNVFYFTFY
jgi:hypothetical protein